MRLDFVFVLVAFGTVIACASCASRVLTSSDVQRESDDDHKSLQEDLLSKMAATSQDSENTTHSVGRIMNAVFGHVQKLSLKLAKNLFSKLKLGGSKLGRNLKNGVSKVGQGVSRGGRRFGQTRGGKGRRFRQQILKGGRRELGRALKGTKNFIIDHRKGISKGLGRFTGEVIGTLLDRNPGEYYPGGAPVDYPGGYPNQYPYGAPRNPDTGGAPVNYPGRYPHQYPYGAPRNPDTGGAPVNYPGGYPHQYPYGAPRNPDTGGAPVNYPGHGAPRNPDTEPRYSIKAPVTETPTGPDPSRYTAPETTTGTPKDSRSHGKPGGGDTSSIKPQGEKVLAKLLEEQPAPLQQDSFIRKQNKYRYSRRGTLYKIKRFFKDIYQGLYSLYLSN